MKKQSNFGYLNETSMQLRPPKVNEKRRNKSYNGSPDAVALLLTPSQILIENQDANLDQVIKMTKISVKVSQKNKLNNFGMPYKTHKFIRDEVYDFYSVFYKVLTFCEITDKLRSHENYI